MSLRPQKAEFLYNSNNKEDGVDGLRLHSTSDLAAVNHGLCKLLVKRGKQQQQDEEEAFSLFCSVFLFPSETSPSHLPLISNPLPGAAAPPPPTRFTRPPRSVVPGEWQPMGGLSPLSLPDIRGEEGEGGGGGKGGRAADDAAPLESRTLGSSSGSKRGEQGRKQGREKDREEKVEEEKEDATRERERENKKKIIFLHHLK